MLKIKQAVILAGGKGERLRPITFTIPKPMVLMNDKPFLEYLICQLKENGIEEIVILSGYLSEKISDFFGDGSAFGIRVKYSVGEVEFETGKRIKFAEDLLDEDFLLLYSDNIFPFNLQNLIEFHCSKDVLATCTIYSNKDSFSKNNIRVDKNGIVDLYDKGRQTENLSGVDIGFFILNKNIVRTMPGSNFSFEKIVLPELINNKQLGGYITNHRYYSIGSLDRLSKTEKYLQRRKIILLDRDGVINKKAEKADYIKKWSKFEFLPGALEAISLLTENGYEIYIISNQAGIAREIMTIEDLMEIHSKMNQEIELAGGKISAIYFCPHGWEDGCYCRKPNPGMLFKAASDHSFDLTKAVFIGDDERDAEAGLNADCPSILVNSSISLLDIAEKLLSEPINPFFRSVDVKIEIIRKYLKSGKSRFFVLIGGCAKTGKTTLVEMLEHEINKVGIDCIKISLDNWILDVNSRSGKETVRERYKYVEIKNAMNKFMNGSDFNQPVYDAKTRTVLQGGIFSSNSFEQGICLIDGVVALEIEELRNMADLKIYVETFDKVRKLRLKSFYADFKKMADSEYEMLINERELEEVPTIKNTKQFADIVFFNC